MNSLLICTLLTFICITTYSSIEIEANNQQDSPLFLTPYIQNGQIDEARNLSRVHLSSSVVSHSGFLTLDEINGAHTFFWFFPAAENPENAPVVIWFEGGPGMSGLYSIFLEHGPFIITPNGDVTEREIAAWTSNHSLIYLDQPMDVGYSFIENENGYVSWGAETAPNVYNLLVQFFKMFPELKKNDFYCSGVSYGGIYAPAAAHYIHTKNQENPEFQINLKGLLLETPWSDPISQLDYGEFLNRVGFIDDHANAHFKEQEGIMKELILQGSYQEAQEVNEQLIYGHGTYLSYYNNATGIFDYYNIVREEDLEAVPIIPIAEPRFREFLHVGNLTFTYSSRLVAQVFNPKIMLSVKPLVEDLLNANYRVLIYAGQLDVITSHVGINTMIQNLNWDGAQEFSTATRKIWRFNDTVAGYAKTARNFTQVLVRNAGHGCAEDQPVWVFDILNKFTQGIPF